jgi:hypothetical protein
VSHPSQRAWPDSRESIGSRSRNRLLKLEALLGLSAATLIRTFSTFPFVMRSSLLCLELNHGTLTCAGFPGNGVRVAWLNTMVHEKPNVLYHPGLHAIPAPTPEWQSLTLPEFIDRYCRKPLSKPLRSLVTARSRRSPQIPSMGEFVSKADVRLMRRIGPQSAAEIIQAMKRLGWRPRLTAVEVSFALASAADSLAKIAARARQLARAHPELTADLVAFSRQATRQAERLKEVRRELARL